MVTAQGLEASGQVLPHEVGRWQVRGRAAVSPGAGPVHQRLQGPPRRLQRALRQAAAGRQGRRRGPERHPAGGGAVRGLRPTLLAGLQHDAQGQPRSVELQLNVNTMAFTW
ncbi:hypothetical protein ON010_g7680 [Phytophthora cinnamomi]|nr:hypothetical protein ON010_g7680 [Phytophthora cinnamomi]